MSESHLVVYVFVLIAPQSMFFKTVVSVHYDTEEYVPHIIFVCQILVNLYFILQLLKTCQW